MCYDYLSRTPPLCLPGHVMLVAHAWGVGVWVPVGLRCSVCVRVCAVFVGVGTAINKNAKGIKSGKGARIGGVGGASGGARRGLGGSGAPKRPVTSGSLDAFVVYEL